MTIALVLQCSNKGAQMKLHNYTNKLPIWNDLYNVSSGTLNPTIPYHPSLISASAFAWVVQMSKPISNCTLCFFCCYDVYLVLDLSRLYEPVRSCACITHLMTYLFMNSVDAAALIVCNCYYCQHYNNNNNHDNVYGETTSTIAIYYYSARKLILIL